MNITDIATDDLFYYAQNETLPTGMLAAIAASDDVEVLVALAGNASLDIATVEELAFKGITDDIDIYAEVRAAVAKRSDLNLMIATGLKADPSYGVRATLAKNASIAPYLSWDGQAPALKMEERVLVAA